MRMSRGILTLRCSVTGSQTRRFASTRFEDTNFDSELSNLFGRKLQGAPAEGKPAPVEDTNALPLVALPLPKLLKLFESQCAAEQHADAIATFDKLTAGGHKPTVEMLNTVLHSCLRDRQFQRATSLFLRVDVFGVSPNQETYKFVMDAYRRAGQLNLALSTFEQMQKADIVPDSAALALLIKTYSQAGQFPKAEHAFNAGRFLGLHLADGVYESFFSACYNAGKWTRAEHLYADMKAKDIPISSFVSNAIVRVYVKKLRFKLAKGVYYNMLMSETPLAAGTFSAMLELYARERDEERLKSVWNDMIAGALAWAKQPFAKSHYSDSDPARPSLFLDHFTGFLGEYRRKGYLSLAKHLMQCIEDARVQLNAQYYAEKMEIQLASKDFDKVFETFQVFRESNMSPHLSCFNVALRACAHSKATDKGQISEHIFCSIRDAGVAPNEETLGALVAIHCTTNDTARVEAHLQRFREAYNVLPTATVYYTLLKHYCKLELLENAHRCFQEMTERSILPSNPTYMRMAELYGKNAMKEEALSMFDLYKSRKKPVAVNYVTIIRAVSMCGDVEATTSLVDEYLAAPHLSEAERKDMGVQNAFLAALCRLEQWKRLDKQYKWLLDHDFELNGSTYAEIMKAVEARGDLLLAEEIRRDMIQREVTPIPRFYVFYIRLFCKHLDKEKTEAALWEFRRRGFALNDDIFNALIDLYVGIGDHVTAHRMRDAMFLQQRTA